VRVSDESLEDLVVVEEALKFGVRHAVWILDSALAQLLQRDHI
jgi:hypothetical protein